MSEKAVVLLSGGQDSTTCLYWALDKFERVEALNIYYGQKHKVEIEAARRVAEFAKVPLTEIETSVFKQIGDSALVCLDGDVNQPHPKNPNLPASFVPGRNLLFLTIAASFAFSKGIRDIVTGVCQTDYSGYPDCRQETIAAMEKTLSLGMESDFSIHTPLMEYSKAGTVFLAASFPRCMEALAYSHTCYNGEFPPCGRCPACVLRAKGFKEAGFIDPLQRRAWQLRSGVLYDHIY